MNEVIEKEKVNIEDMIYEIRGVQVMLDSDLAKLYKCKNGTKEINQAVKNNPDKFPERFSWKLNDDESKSFLVKYFDQKKEKRGGRFKNPRVFTEQGVAMLATILRTEVATRISINIMDAFVAMRYYIGIDNRRISNIEEKILDHDRNIKLLMDSFRKFDEKKVVNEIYFNGQIYDAYSKILDILKQAHKELILIDAYADKNVLDIIRNLDVNVILIVKKCSLLSKKDIEKYKEQYNNLSVIYNDNYHDRYFIIDKSIIYHCGTSINRIGYKTFSITLIDDEIIKESLINKIKEII
jgi:hypothetical protein